MNGKGQGPEGGGNVRHAGRNLVGRAVQRNFRVLSPRRQRGRAVSKRWGASHHTIIDARTPVSNNLRLQSTPEAPLRESDTPCLEKAHNA